MSYTIISKIEGMKLKNGKVIPFALRAESDVRTYGNSRVWDWYNIFSKKQENFMFEDAKQLTAQMEDWHSQGCFKNVNGGFCQVEGLMRKMKRAFDKPSFKFEKGLVMVRYNTVNKERTKMEQVTFFPPTEEEFLDYMEKNKQRSLIIALSPYQTVDSINNM